MAGPFGQMPFNPVNPQNPALYQPSPHTDQSQTTAAILSQLARSLFDPTGAAAAMPAPAPVAPTAAGGFHNPDQGGFGPSRIPFQDPSAGGFGPAPSGGGPVPQPSQTAGPPMGPASGGALPPPMLRPDADTGAVTGGDPAAVLGASVQAAQLAKDSPDVTKSVINDLMTMGGDPEQNKWLALAKAGFAMAASKNPSILGAAGEGAEAGLSDYLKSRQETLQNRYTAAQLQQGEQTRQANIAAQQASQALAKQEYEQKVYEFSKTLPIEEAKAKAMEAMYYGHTNYFDARAAAPAGGGTAGGWRNEVYAQLNAAGVPPQQIAQILSGKGADAVSIARSILTTSPTLAMDSDGPAKAMAQAQQLIALSKQGQAADLAATPPAGGTKPAAGPLPAGAKQAAPGVPDGTLGGGGQYTARGGFWYPAGQ